MRDFLFYALFSGFEYMAVVFLTMCVFNLDFRYHYKAALLVSSFLVHSSYLIIETGMTASIPIPLIIFISMFLMFIGNLGRKKWKYSIVITIIGLIIYFLVQVGITLVFLSSKLIAENDINSAFSSQTYIMQTLCASVLITVGLYTKIIGNGFGFMFRKGKVFTFLVTSLSLFTIALLCWFSLILSEKISLVIMVGIVLIVSLLVLLVFSHKRDKFEYLVEGGEKNV